MGFGAKSDQNQPGVCVEFCCKVDYDKRIKHKLLKYLYKTTLL